MSANVFEGIDVSKHSKLVDLLGSIRSVEINGKTVIQTQDGEFIEYVLMDEQYFVEHWLVQFAIGNVSGRNYFNQEAWNKLTDGYTKGVIILNDDQQPVVLIRKFIDMDLNANQQAIFDQYTRTASHAANIPNKDEVDQIMTSLSSILSGVAQQNPDYDTLTALVPYEYYLSKGIDPTVVKQVIYIRDTYTYKGQPIQPDGDLLKQVEAILYKNARNELITKEEIALINEITDNQFEFNGTVNKVETNNSQPAQEEKFDPFSE
ncbi:hypothetical protein PQD71_gp132 [Kosakonia phage Kc263]|uniref:Uncharacterized protein n=1 Tax=Kosakonia phage Kc263 TaxID=2863194 RepID=A0AAE7WFQ1_9CAUD|nr:hypothetical protein PQD71_gp132 [Kosakonia phage Kc263]QYN80025.1 hypothetical protein [Kosakonia phage Kc263]